MLLKIFLEVFNYIAQKKDNIMYKLVIIGLLPLNKL